LPSDRGGAKNGFLNIAFLELGVKPSRNKKEGGQTHFREKVNRRITFRSVSCLCKKRIIRPNGVGNGWGILSTWLLTGHETQHLKKVEACTWHGDWREGTQETNGLKKTHGGGNRRHNPIFNALVWTRRLITGPRSIL